MLAGFLLYCFTATAVILYLIVSVAPIHGNNNIFVYLAICSLVGSLSVMSVKVSNLLVKIAWRASQQPGSYSNAHVWFMCRRWASL